MKMASLGSPLSSQKSDRKSLCGPLPFASFPKKWGTWTFFKSGPGKPNQRKVSSWTFRRGIPAQKFEMWIGLFYLRKSTRIYKNGRNSWTFRFGPFFGLVCRGDSWFFLRAQNGVFLVGAKKFMLKKFICFIGPLNTFDKIPVQRAPNPQPNLHSPVWVAKGGHPQREGTNLGVFVPRRLVLRWCEMTPAIYEDQILTPTPNPRIPY